MPDENVVQEPVETVETAETETVETPVEVTTETVETPEAPIQTETVVEEELPYYVPQQTEAPTFTPDEDGNIDPNAFYAQVKADAVREMREEMRFQETEKRAWDKIEQKYPDIKDDPELRDILHAQRIADVAQGGKGDLNKVADKLFGKLNTYQTKGKAQAQVSEKVQKSAAVASPTNNNVESGGDAELIERMSRGDEVAKTTLIEQWLEQGKI